jgi:hypothetical protein
VIWSTEEFRDIEKNVAPNIGPRGQRSPVRVERRSILIYELPNGVRTAPHTKTARAIYAFSE